MANSPGTGGFAETPVAQFVWSAQGDCTGSRAGSHAKREGYPNARWDHGGLDTPAAARVSAAAELDNRGYGRDPQCLEIEGTLDWRVMALVTGLDHEDDENAGGAPESGRAAHGSHAVHWR